MSMQTQYVVQAYSKAPKGKINADAPFLAKDVSHARRIAEKLASIKPAVVAFVSKGDADTGDYEEPKLIFAHGDRLPPEVAEMEKL